MSEAEDRPVFLAACKATDTRNQALEGIRDKGSEVILAVFRLLKTSLVHALDNKAIQLTCKDTHGIVSDFAATVGGYVSITYVEDTIFVCGQLLRASRSIYESAMEVGKLLGACGVSEISFTGDVSQKDMLDLCAAFSIAVRDPTQRNRLNEAKLNNIVVREVDSTLQSGGNSGDDERGLPEMQRALSAYASALVVMRQFFERLAAGKPVMPHRIKRVAQRMVAIGEDDEGALIAMTTLANAHRDEAGRAVQSAILSVLIGRRLTPNRTGLAQLAMAALMTDVGRVRLAGLEGLEKFIPLSDDVERAVPALTSSLCIATGGVNMQNAMRTVAAYEATHMERQELVGPLYQRKMAPMVHSKILYLVRQVLDRIAPRDGSRAKSPLDALAEVSKLPNVDEVAYKLLIQAVGVLPTGTVVEFETGEWGIVIGPSTNPKALTRPRVNLITDRNGQVFSRPKPIDLGDTSQGKRYPRITGVIEPSRARFNITGAVMGDAKGTVAPAPAA